MSDLLTVSEAATVASVSARTMRRWVKSGQVRTVGQGHGRRVVAASLSELPATVDTNGHEQRSHDVTVSATTVTETDSGHEAGHLARLVTDLTERLAEQAAIAAMWQERCRVLGDQLALAAPVPSHSPGAAQETVHLPPVADDAPVVISSRWRALAPWVLAALAIVAVVVLLVVLW